MRQDEASLLEACETALRYNLPEPFATHDLNCSAALLCKGYKLLSVNKKNPRKAIFVFKREDGIDEVIELFWSDLLKVKARSYTDNLKALKNRLYSSE